MNKYFTKRGLMDVETILSSLLILAVFIATIYASTVCYNRYKSVNPSPKAIISVYNNIVKSLRLDAQRAAKTSSEKDTFSLFDKNSNLISKYELKDGNLVRYDKDNKISTLLEKVESLSFTTRENLPNLLTVRIFPEDKNEIPFFTSFALRGYENKNAK